MESSCKANVNDKALEFNSEIVTYTAEPLSEK